MSIQLSPEVYAQASTQEWERIYGRRVASALRYEGPAAALALLGERGERTAQSALHAFEARALIALERADEAARLIDQALAAYPPVGNQGRLAELLWLRAQAAQWMGQPTDALEWLQRLLPVAESLRSGLPLVQTLAEILSPRMPLTAEGRTAFSHQLADAMDRLDASQIDTERAMIRLALVRLEAGYGALLGRLAPQVLGEFRHALQSGLIDMVPVLDHFRELSRQMKTPVPINDPGTNDSMLWLANAAENLIGNLRGPLPDQMAAEALRCLMQAEQVTLLSATLAGLEEYREPWELTIHAEVSV
jgi:tetratricopeptide (TPR) repeat protein